MARRLGTLLGALLALVLSVTLLGAAPAPADESAPARTPDWAALVPDRTTQVVRTVSSHEFCRRVWCTVTQAWERDAQGAWTKVREFRSTMAETPSHG